MKKMITLLFSMCIVAVSFAQYNNGYDQRNDNYAYNHGDHYYNNDNFGPARDRDFQIQKINDEFQNRINCIMNDPYMRRHEKRDAIKQARLDRDRRLQFLSQRNHDYGYGRWHNDGGYNKESNW